MTGDASAPRWPPSGRAGWTCKFNTRAVDGLRSIAYPLVVQLKSEICGDSLGGLRFLGMGMENYLLSAAGYTNTYKTSLATDKEVGGWGWVLGGSMSKTTASRQASKRQTEHQRGREFERRGSEKKEFRKKATRSVKKERLPKTGIIEEAHYSARHCCAQLSTIFPNRNFKTFTDQGAINLL